VLGDVRLVVGYLGWTFVAAAVAVGFRVAQLLG
jgi:hypothetical protein